MIIVSNINIAVAIKKGGRPTRLLPHAKMLLVPRKLFFPLSLLGRLCSETVQVSLLSRFILVEYSMILINPYGVHFYSKHFEHIFDFLTPFSRPGGQILLSGITS